MQYSTFMVVLGFGAKCGNAFWPPAYRVDLNDRKTFVIASDDAEYDDENENEMIQPVDMEGIESLEEDEQRYKPLHSHVEQYNQRAARTATEFSEMLPNFQPNLEDIHNFVEEAKPFVAGFKHELDEYDFGNLEEQILEAVRKKRNIVDSLDSSELTKSNIVKLNSKNSVHTIDNETGNTTNEDNLHGSRFDKKRMKKQELDTDKTSSNWEPNVYRPYKPYSSNTEESSTTREPNVYRPYKPYSSDANKTSTTREPNVYGPYKPYSSDANETSTTREPNVYRPYNLYLSDADKTSTTKELNVYRPYNPYSSDANKTSTTGEPTISRPYDPSNNTNESDSKKTDQESKTDMYVPDEEELTGNLPDQATEAINLVLGENSGEKPNKPEKSPLDQFLVGGRKDLSLIAARTDDPEEESYDYERFKAEYYQLLETSRKSNKTFNYTDNGEPEETAKDALKKIVDFNIPKNCTKEELTQFGAKALECLAFDLEHVKTTGNVRKIMSRTWMVVRIWIAIYLCITVPCWLQWGYCCCCFRCEFCDPNTSIHTAKKYYADNPPGVLVHQPTLKAEEPLPTKYKPSLFELDAYEKFETAIRNL